MGKNGLPARAPLPREGSRWTGRRLAMLALPVLLGLILFALWERPKPAKVARGNDAPESSEAPVPGEPSRPSPEEVARQTPPAPPPSAPASAAPANADPPPVIDSITLEKTSVCAGEENLVTVKAHTVNKTDAHLHYVIDGHMGSSFPVQAWPDDKGGIVGEHTVTVFGRGNVATTMPMPKYEVRDCRPVRMATIDTRVRSNTWSDFDIVAKVLSVPADPGTPDHPRKAPPPPAPFVAKSYTWRFGDGESSTTTSPVVEHDYEGRAQTTLYSYFLLEVAAQSKDGEIVKGRTTLALINPAFEAYSAKGIVALMLELTPRFPVLGSDGKVTQLVRLWHNDPEAVTIERATRTIYYEKGSGQTAPQDVSPAQVLGTATIPAGKNGITATVILDVDAQPEVASVTFELYGHSAAGNPVLGSFSVMQPPPKPTASNSQMIRDGMLMAKVIKARELLHQDTVSDEEIWALERQGAFANLQPAPIASGPPPGPPADTPSRDPRPTAGKGAPTPTRTPDPPPGSPGGPPNVTSPADNGRK